MVTAITIAAFLSTTAISLAPNVILFLFPNYQPSKDGINALDIGQALAAGMYTYCLFSCYCESREYNPIVQMCFYRAN
jgi:hypothetical protein